MKIFYFLLFVFMASCVLNEKPDQTADENISEEKTKEILDHHWVAFQNNDLEETMKDYTEESVLITPNATYTGLEEIENNFVNAFKAFPKDSTTFTLDKSIVVKDVGYILWRSKTPTFTLSYATDTFIIREGKIIRQTYAGMAQ
ncbi:MAG: nuclear transport factor 2 family protein [Cyclobacteriaceae bacterium]